MTSTTGRRYPFKLPGLLAVALLLCSLPFNAWSHATGENYVWLNIAEGRIDGRFEVRLEDLRAKLGLELSSDADEARAQVQDAAPLIQDYIRERFGITAAGSPRPIEFTRTDLLESEWFGHFAQLYYQTAPFDVPQQLTVRNQLFFEDDPFHRSLLLVERDDSSGKEYGGEFTALVFSPANGEQELDFTNIRGLLSKKQFVWQGMLHIWVGIDHILFLIALLLPAVLTRDKDTWVPVDDFKTALWNIVKIVTVFTIAHSITLSLAALEIVQLPSRLVESVIALSIILVALNNVFPRYREGTLLIVFVFGLFHGLGFASVMGGLPFRMQDLVWVMIAFNVGVEIGQIVIVSAIVPLIYWARHQNFYRRHVPVYGSLALAVVAAYWLMERALGWSI